MSPSKRKSRTNLALVSLIIVCTLAVVVVVTLARRKGVEEVSRPSREQSPEGEGGTRAVVLYFGSPDGTGLIETTREIMASPEPSSLLAGVMRELVSGPSDGGVATVPDGTRLNSAYIAGGIAYLDFSGEMKNNFGGGSTQEYVLLASIVRSVSENFPDVSRVQLLVEGKIIESIGGHYDITEPLNVPEWR